MLRIVVLAEATESAKRHAQLWWYRRSRIGVGHLVLIENNLEVRIVSDRWTVPRIPNAPKRSVTLDSLRIYVHIDRQYEEDMYAQEGETIDCLDARRAVISD